MLRAKVTAPNGQLVWDDEVRNTLGVLENQFDNQRILVLIPDHTRSLPLPFLFRVAEQNISSPASLAESEEIQSAHLAEALQYKPKLMMGQFQLGNFFSSTTGELIICRNILHSCQQNTFRRILPFPSANEIVLMKQILADEGKKIRDSKRIFLQIVLRLLYITPSSTDYLFQLFKPALADICQQ